MKNIKRILSVLLISVLFISCLNVFAEEPETVTETEMSTETVTEADNSVLFKIDEEETFNSLQEEYEKLEQSINENKNEVNNIQKDINKNFNYIAVLNSQTDILNSQIKILDDEIQTSEEARVILEDILSSTEKEIEVLEKEIEDIKKDTEKTEKELDKATGELQEFLKDEYISGNSSNYTALEIMLTAKTMEEYFERQEILAQIRDKKTGLVNAVNEHYTMLNSLKDKAEYNKIQLETNKELIYSFEKQRIEHLEIIEKDKAQLESKQENLLLKKEELREIISELDTDSEIYKEQIKKDREEMEIISSYVDNYISSHSLSELPDITFENDGQMQWPVNFSSYISCGYPNYSDGSFHGGIDICAVGGNSLGRPFNAAQSGVVIMTVNNGYYNNGFGNYCVIDHGDGTYTLYAHARSLVVSQGDTVQKGENIGFIGATGNVTGPHLHFEVRVKDESGNVRRVNPLNYVSNET